MTPPERLYRVFISSTFLDNKERRELVEKAVTTVGMVWHGMELFTAENRPAKEACLAYAREADLLVGIIAHRYGWIPEGDTLSITEMEYDAAKGAGKDCLMFQIDPALAVHPDKDFDDGTDKWKKQEKLAAFKQKIAKDQMPGYFNERSLQAQVQEALRKWREQKEPARRTEPELPEFTSKSKKHSHAVPDEAIENYRRKAESFHATLPVAGFATKLEVLIDIDEVYVPLHARIDLRGVKEESFIDSCHAESCLKETDRLEISLPDAFKESEIRKRRGLVILGDPGSGKTTHLKRILLFCLRKSSEEMGLPKGMLPVFLPLRDLKDLDHGLDQFIQDQLDKPHLDTPEAFGKKLIRRGNLLFLLDGLDEVVDIRHREKVSEWIKEAIQAHPSCRFVVSCRFAGYSKTVQMNAHFLELHIRPLDSDQAYKFVHDWYRVVEKGLHKDPDQAEHIAAEKADDLVNRLNEPDFRSRRVFELTRNPLLLTNICLVHYHRGTLPRKRARLYEECIDVLLQHWRESKKITVDISAETGRRVLQPAALWLHQKEKRTRATASELAPIIGPALKAVKWSNGSAEEFLKTVRDESGLLTGWGPDQFGFMHLGFQEYLAAREIRSRAFSEAEVIRELATHFGDSWWQEVILIFLALEDPSLFEPFMKAVVNLPEFPAHSGFVETCFEDAAEISLVPFVDLLKSKPGKDKPLWERQLTALKIVERHDPDAVNPLKSILAVHPFQEIQKRVADHALQETRVQLSAGAIPYELVRIPGGEFMMGSSDKEAGRYNNEGPRHKVQVPDFYMGKYPVTNEEYGFFLKENPKVKPPKYWGDRKFNQAKQPVVGVSWEDAKQFAEWAALRLPSEAEWEFACRAGTDTAYYSGNSDKDLARVGWYSENSGEQLHPVGEKEPNAFGLYDMHGNIREWVEDDWHNSYKGAPVDGRPWIDTPRGVHRVIRGGSWFFNARFCRSAIRGDRAPDIRGYDWGFRLSRSV